MRNGVSKKRALLLLAAWLAAGLLGCGGKPAPLTASDIKGYSENGVASWYGGKYHGRLTASGERYDMHAMTAAHRTLPFGTVVDVVNRENGRKTRVRINDRGPFRKGRIIDLSHAAARELGMVERGLARVKIKVVARR